MGRKHENLLNETKLYIQKELSEYTPRFFPRHVGMFFTQRGTPIRISSKGQSDNILLLNVKNIMIHVEIEAKIGKDHQSDDQKKWESFIVSMGGKYVLLESKEQILEELKIYIKYLQGRIND